MKRTRDQNRAHLLNTTTTIDTIAGDPAICRPTRITCCHTVRELRSMVPKPVPVAALTQMKRESMYLMRNFPLDAQNMTDQRSGIMILKRRQRVFGIGSTLKRESAYSQRKYMHPEEIQMGLEPRESHNCSATTLQMVGGRDTDSENSSLILQPPAQPPMSGRSRDIPFWNFRPPGGTFPTFLPPDRTHLHPSV